MSLMLFVVLVVGTTARLTRLATTDHITAPLRAWLMSQTDRVSYFLTCPWCVSMWLAPPVLALGWWPAHHGTAAWWWFPAATLTTSHAVGLLAHADDD